MNAIEEQFAAGLVTRDELAAGLGGIQDELAARAPAPDGRIDALVEAVSSVQADLGERFDSKLAAIESRLDTDLDAMDVIAHAVDRLRDDLARVPESGALIAAPTDEAIASLERRLQALEELDARVQALAETIEAPSRVQRATGEDLPDRLEQELERFRMALERITLHLGEHDRALVDIIRSGMTERLEELAGRVDELAGGDVASTGAGMPNVFGDVRALMARVEEAETASQADRDRLMTRLERMASSIDWRLQRLETDETPESEVRKLWDAPGRIRTFDLALRRRALYPLSYGRSRRQCTDGRGAGRAVRSRAESGHARGVAKAGMAATITNMVFAIDDPLSTDAKPAPHRTQDPRPRNGGGRRTPGTGSRAQR